MEFYGKAWSATIAFGTADQRWPEVGSFSVDLLRFFVIVIGGPIPCLIGLLEDLGSSQNRADEPK